MNKTLNDIYQRASTKDFTSEVVSDELLSLVLKAGTCAPTGMNKQSPLIICVKTKEMVEKLKQLNASILGKDFDPFYNAQTIIVVLADKKVSTHVEDGSLVLGNMMIASESLNLGACWIHRAKEMFETKIGKEILKEWNIPDNYVGIGNLAIGYYKTKPLVKKHKDNYIIYK